MRKKRMSLWILIWILSLGSLQAQGDESASLRIAIAEQMGFEAESIIWRDGTTEKLGTFCWSGSWIEQTAYTFLSELDLTGTAMPGTIIYYGILTKENNGWNIWDRGSAEVGDSGLVQEKVSLPKIGWQYFAVFVRQRGTIYGCVYQVERMSRELESELQNLRMNLYEACIDRETP